jgi:hypothetical protein
MEDWYYISPGSGATGNMTLNWATYNYMPALLYIAPSGDTGKWVVNFPNVKASTTYNFSVDVAGSGTAYLNAWNGSSNAGTSTVTLGASYQTLSETVTTASSFSPAPQLQVVASSTPSTIYFRNASVSPVSGTTDFYTGLETSNSPSTLTWTNTVDTTSPGGGESNVSRAVLQSSTTMTHGGTYAINYGGTASGGSTTHAYMEAFSSGASIYSTSYLSYWVFPMSPKGAEPGASSTTGLDSTCVAIDMIFTDGTALRNLSVKDQYGNVLSPSTECNHLFPDQWNYVVSNLGTLSGKIISRIDIGYDQPGASGNYGGYVDDIRLRH